MSAVLEASIIGGLIGGGVFFACVFVTLRVIDRMWRGTR